MSKKSERLEIYVSEEQKQAIESAADRADMTRSAWLREAADRALRAQEQDELTGATEAEERIERLISDARDTFEQQSEEIADEIATATKEYHDMLAVSGVYSIASFRLLGDFGDFSDPQRQAAIEAGAMRLRDWPVSVDPADVMDSDGSATAADTSARASESRAQDSEDSNRDRDDGDDPADSGVF